MMLEIQKFIGKTISKPFKIWEGQFEFTGRSEMEFIPEKLERALCIPISPKINSISVETDRFIINFSEAFRVKNYIPDTNNTGSFNGEWLGIENTHETRYNHPSLTFFNHEYDMMVEFLNGLFES